ncbi:MAG: deoxyribodipyrimidine photo-lyase [Verrucomicrobium sp.]|nr:deoxyribodipyrimidine photo-lyase [Verrucomicrobium sp.]
MKTALVWFRRDLRVADNTALHAAGRDFDRVYGLYVFEDRELKDSRAGAPRLHFILESLDSLGKNLAERGSQLLWRRGVAEEEVLQAVRETGAEAVYYNFDGEPGGCARDKRVRAKLRAQGVLPRAWKDDVLHDGREVLKADGKPYVVFTPYSRAWRALPKEAPLPAPRFRQPAGPLPEEPLPTLAELGFTLEADPARLAFQGGERAGRDRLKAFAAGPLLRYGSLRDFPAADGASRLSAHLTVGTLSPRTVYAKAMEARAAHPRAGEEVDTFVGELIWREFYRQILWHFPQVETEAFKPAYKDLPWRNDAKQFQAWCEGRTGYPIVDAGMRQLNQTGWMHNRLRMIAAMFLTKHLLVSWQWGERYFMQRLADGDLASNNGSWQWSASTGTDAQPYFRIFNPNRQAERFDPEGEFIHRYVPEADRPGYPRPIVDHAAQRLKTLALFKGHVG